MPVENITNSELGEEYKRILQLNGISEKIDEILIHESGATGDGMISLTNGVTIKFVDSKRPNLHLFVKTHTENPGHEQFVEETKAFEKEAIVLSSYVPAAKEFCKVKGLADFVDFYPKCFYGGKDKIVMEDLAKERSYQVIPHEILHDFDTASFALETLAKHHALSYAMIAESGGVEPFEEKFPNINFDAAQCQQLIAMIVTSVENAFTTSLTILEKNKTDGAQAAIEHISGLKGSGPDMVNTMMCDSATEKFKVLCHGDYKNNNLMFLKDPLSGSLRHMIAIDLQAVRIDSPALDLGFYLFTSVEHKTRQTRLEELLTTYIDRLKEFSNKLGHPIQLTFEDLMSQCRRKFPFGFVMGLTLVGPGTQLFKKIDITKVEFSQIFEILQNSLLEWIDENPEEGRNVANQIVGLVHEYKQLGL